MPITVKHKDLKAYFGDEDHLDIAQRSSFPEMIFRMLSERVPNKEELSVFELILNLSIDHGPDTPSSVKTIEKAKTGSTISESVAVGVEQINDRHGGAIEPAMRFFYEVKDENLNKEGIKQLVNTYMNDKKTIAGFGHRIYKNEDPRAALILNKLRGISESKSFVDIAIKIEQSLMDLKRTKLPLNIDGAIAVALCTFGWNAELGKAVFIIARVPGLCAHFITNKP